MKVIFLVCQILMIFLLLNVKIVEVDLMVSVKNGINTSLKHLSIALTLFLPNATVVEFTVHCQMGLLSKLKGTVDSCLFLTFIRDEIFVLYFKMFSTGDIIISYIEVNKITDLTELFVM